MLRTKIACGNNSACKTKIKTSQTTTAIYDCPIKGGHSKKLTFLSPPIASKHWVFHSPKFQPLKCLLSWRNLSIKKPKIWLNLAARLCLCNIMLSNSKLAESRKVCSRLGILHKVSKMYFFQPIIDFNIFTAIIFGVWSTFCSK